MNDIDIVYNDPPLVKGRSNFFLQQKTTYAGLIHAKNLGATHVMKVRSDMVFSDISALIDVMMEHKNTLFFPGWHNFQGGYFMDFFQFGEIDDMINLWHIKPAIYDVLFNSRRASKKLQKTFARFRIPEQILTQNYFANFQNRKVKYILPIMQSLDIKCRWLKYGIDFEKFIDDPLCNCHIHT